jgi:hypothetical protein
VVIIILYKGKDFQCKNGWLLREKRPRFLIKLCFLQNLSDSSFQCFSSCFLYYDVSLVSHKFPLQYVYDVLKVIICNDNPCYNFQGIIKYTNFYNHPVSISQTTCSTFMPYEY